MVSETPPGPPTGLPSGVTPELGTGYLPFVSVSIFWLRFRFKAPSAPRKRSRILSPAEHLPSRNLLFAFRHAQIPACADNQGSGRGDFPKSRRRPIRRKGAGVLPFEPCVPASGRSATTKLDARFAQTSMPLFSRACDQSAATGIYVRWRPKRPQPARRSCGRGPRVSRDRGTDRPPRPTVPPSCRNFRRYRRYRH